MQNGISDIEQDLILERARAAELQKKLEERDERVCNLSYALRTCQRELKLQADSFAADIQNISTLCGELLEICSKSPIAEAEARRRALALSRIAVGRMQ